MRNGEQLTDVYMTAAQTLIQKEFPHLDGLQSPLLRQEDQLLAMVDEGVQIHHIDMTSTSIIVTSSLLHFVVINWHSCTSCWLSQKIVKLRVDPHVTW